MPHGSFTEHDYSTILDHQTAPTRTSQFVVKMFGDSSVICIRNTMEREQVHCVEREQQGNAASVAVCPMIKLQNTSL